VRGRVAAAVLALLLGRAATASAQRSQWSDAVYVPGRWAGGRLVPAATSNPQSDTLALIARVDYFAAPPRWRAEVRRSADGKTLGNQPEVLIGNAAAVVVLTPVGATPFEQHALSRDPIARAAAAVFDQGGRRQGAASGRLVERGAGGAVARVVFRRPTRGAAFDDALLNPGGASGSRNLLSSNIRAVGDQRNAAVVATAGARGVDRVSTPGGQVRVTPDTMAVVRMERFAVGALALEEFLRLGRLGAYGTRADSAGKP
jgi:hypothetical protein